MHGPGTFRACLLLSAMHYSWLEGSLEGMEETYLHHKLEAMRLVNEQIGDPVLNTSDGCINTIAALAMAEVSEPLCNLPLVIGFRSPILAELRLMWW